jgi:hypothetical protein
MNCYDEHQLLLIMQLFKILDLTDDISLAPYNILKKNKKLINVVEYAPYDLILEEECIFGYNCVFKNKPLICPRNHQGLSNIKKGTIIPNLLCRYERPWKIMSHKNQIFKCNNINCWFSHLKGRTEHLKFLVSM